VTWSQSVLSTEYIQIPVWASQQGQPYDPSGDVVQFAFTPPGAGPVTWVPGDWWTAAQPDGSRVAFILVGPANGGTPLGDGIWDMWMKIADSPEVPVRVVATVEITP
jgi:hypothetical protein